VTVTLFVFGVLVVVSNGCYYLFRLHDRTGRGRSWRGGGLMAGGGAGGVELG
jgi:hypothetical protein